MNPATNGQAGARFEMCPVCHTLKILGGKWRFSAIWQLYLGQRLHYNELKRRLNGITNIMLTRVLEALEEQGLTRRTVLSAAPLQVEYSLTEKCAGLLPALEIISRWGCRQMLSEDFPAAQGGEQRCLTARTFEALGGKWRLSIIWQLMRSPMRYNELKRCLPGITNAMLTRALQALEEYRLVRRTEFRQIPPHVEYSLTQNCEELLPALEIISRWGAQLLAQR